MIIHQDLIGKQLVFSADAEYKAITGLTPSERTATIRAVIFDGNKTAVWLQTSNGALVGLPITDINGVQCSLT